MLGGPLTNEEDVIVPYYAVIEKEPTSSYGVFFPDLPGCTSAGKTLEEACNRASEALSLHLEWMMKDGDPIPEPRSLAQVEADPVFLDDLTNVVAFLRVFPEMAEAAE